MLTLLSGCVAPPSRIDRAAEEHAASSPTALMHVAQAADRSGNPSTAAVFYRRVLELDPSNADAAIGLAHALTVQGDADEAIDELRARLPQITDQASVRLRRTLGDLLILSHRPTEAVAVFRQGLASMPSNAPLLVGLGVALDNCRDHPAAQTAYRQALVVAPDSVAAHNDLALSIALGGDTTTALADLTRLRSDIVSKGGSANDLATIDGNTALVYAMRGNLSSAARAGSGAATDPKDLAANMRFYSALAPGNGAVDNRGLSAAPDE